MTQLAGSHYSPNPVRKELTVRGLIIGIVITLVFTAANVYFGLKAGLTFSTSIPAAVISMAILRGFRDATIQENNIVQTVASAAGTLSSIIFVLPGLIMKVTTATAARVRAGKEIVNCEQCGRILYLGAL